MELTQHPLVPKNQILLKEETRSLRDALLTYRLWSVGYGRKMRYHISITENGNTAEHIFETDSETAVSIFRNAVNSTMTPYRLITCEQRISNAEALRNSQEYQKNTLHFHSNML